MILLDTQSLIWLTGDKKKLSLKALRYIEKSISKKEIFVSGKRAYDMALRLKYADIETNEIKIKEKIKDAINEASFSLANGETLYILPTYTVLLEMQRKGICKGQPL